MYGRRKQGFIDNDLTLLREGKKNKADSLTLQDVNIFVVFNISACLPPIDIWRSSITQNEVTITGSCKNKIPRLKTKYLVLKLTDNDFLKGL